MFPTWLSSKVSMPGRMPVHGSEGQYGSININLTVDGMMVDIG